MGISLSDIAAPFLNPFKTAKDVGNTVTDAVVGKSPNLPTTDYTNAAIVNQIMSNANTSSPFGSQTWDYSKTYTLPNGQVVPIPTSTTSLSPQLQGMFNTSLGNLNSLPDINQQFQDLGQTPTFNQDFVNNQYKNIMATLQPDINAQREQLISGLVNQGITATSNPEAYDAAMRQLNNQVNNLELGAQNQAFGQGSQMYQNQLTGRNQGVNEIGQRYGLGSNQAFAPLNAYQGLFGLVPNQQTAPSGYLGATQMQGQQAMNAYNQAQAQRNNFMQGLFGLGAAGILA